MPADRMTPPPLAPPPPPAAPDPEARVFSAGEERAIGDHFREFGFVVVADVLDQAQVDATVRELWESPSLLGGHPHLRRDDPSTWGGEGWPAGSRNFLDPLDPCAEVASWRNRVNPAVSRVFDLLWERLPCADDGAGRAVVSVDRFGVMRPARAPQQDGGKGPKLEMPEWRTSRNWLHWDQNPWSTPGFSAVQGLLGLAEGTPDAGGFVTVPGFQGEFARWGREHPEGTVPKRTADTVPFPVPLDDGMQARRRRVLVPSGGLLVWDSRLPHENCPTEGEGWRLVQYVTYKRLSREALRQRAAAWRTGFRTGLLPVDFVRRFTPDEQARLGMATDAEEEELLARALEEGAGLPRAALEAAGQLRRAYRLRQTAVGPAELQQAGDLFKAAFAVSPGLREPLRRVAAAEGSYLPLWIL